MLTETRTTRQPATATSRPPTGEGLEPAVAATGRALLHLSSIRSLMHAHSTRTQLTADSDDAVQYLLEERDGLVASIDEAIRLYAAAVDPSGRQAALVDAALAETEQPERLPAVVLVRRRADGTEEREPVYGAITLVSCQE